MARLFKTRTLASRACRAGRVKVNGRPSKPHRSLEPGDRIEFSQRNWKRLLVVKEPRDRPLPRSQAARLYEDQSPPRPRRDPAPGLQLLPPAARRKGKGRPSKKEGRQMERLKRG